MASRNPPIPHYSSLPTESTDRKIYLSTEVKSDEIWNEYYPLIQPVNPEQGFGSTGPIGQGAFAAEMIEIYKDAVVGFVVTLFSMSILALTGLIFCRNWGWTRLHPITIVCELMWHLSPVGAAIALRRIVSMRIMDSNKPQWTLRPIYRLFKCLKFQSMLRLLVLSYFIPLLCQALSYLVASALHVLRPLNQDYIDRIERFEESSPFNQVFSSNWVSYIFYAVIGGIVWDFLPPPRFDFGTILLGRPIGCSWLLFSITEEIGWSGSLYPVLAVVCAHSAYLAALMTGAIWALWYWPFIIAEHLHIIPEESGLRIGPPASIVGDGSLAYALVSFTLLLIGSRLIMCWIQGSNSFIIWTSVVYHSTHNLYVQSIFGQLSAPVPGRHSLFYYFSGESSIIFIFAVWFSACILARLFSMSSCLNMSPLLR